jgi:hypothetical protein
MAVSYDGDLAGALIGANSQSYMPNGGISNALSPDYKRTMSKALGRESGFAPRFSINQSKPSALAAPGFQMGGLIASSGGNDPRMGNAGGLYSGGMQSPLGSLAPAPRPAAPARPASTQPRNPIASTSAIGWRPSANRPGAAESMGVGSAPVRLTSAPAASAMMPAAVSRPAPVSSPEENIAAAINSELNAGNAVRTNAMGGMILNKQTGRPIEYDMADAMNVSSANRMADQAAAQSRWNEGIGVGDQMNQRRQKEIDDVMGRWADWYSQKRQANDSAAAAMGVGTPEYLAGKARADQQEFDRMKLTAARGVAEREMVQQQLDAINPRNAAYRARLAESQERNDMAGLARSADMDRQDRMRAGVPASPQEAMMLAMRNGAFMNPAASLKAFGDASYNMDRAMTERYNTDAMTALGVGGLANDRMEIQSMAEGRAMQRELEARKAELDMSNSRAEQTMKLSQLFPPLVEQQTFDRVFDATGNRVQALAAAEREKGKAAMMYNSLAPQYNMPLYENERTFTSGGVPAPQGLMQNTVPDLRGMQFDPSQFESNRDSSKALYRSLKSRFGDVTPQMWKSAKENFGVNFGPSVRDELYNASNFNSEAGLVDMLQKIGKSIASPVMGAPTPPGNRNAVDSAEESARIYELEYGIPVQAGWQDVSESFGLRPRENRVPLDRLQ